MLDKNIAHRLSRLGAIKYTTIAAGIAKAITFIVQFAIVSMTLGYLGQSLYGLWVTISAVIAFLQISDLGIGNVLISFVPKEQTLNGSHGVMGLLKRGLIATGLISILLLGFGCPIIYNADWGSLINVPMDYLGTARDAMFSCLVIFCISMPVSLAQQVRLGLLQGHINAIFQSIGQILNLLFVYLGVRYSASLAELVILSGLGAIISQSLNLLMLFLQLNLKSAGLLRASIPMAKIFTYGVPFLILQITTLFISQADLIVIAHYLGPNQVAEYSIAIKYFSIPAVLLSFYLYSVWPAYSDAAAKMDHEWICQFFRGSLKKSLFFSLTISCLIYLAAPFAISIWTKNIIAIDPILFLILAGLSVLNAVGGNVAALLNGLHIMRTQVLLAIFSAITILVIGITITPKVGIIGPPLATMVIYIFGYAYILRYIFKNKHSIIVEALYKNKKVF